MISATHGDRYEDGNGILFEALDFQDQKFQLRVGPVFDKSWPQGHPEQGIWIELNGEEFLMSQSTWFALNSHIHRRIDEWKKFRDIMNKES